MRNTPTTFLKRAVAEFMLSHGAKRKHTAKEYEAMLNDVFAMLSEKLLDGYVIKPPFDFGDFSMKVIHDYKVSEKHSALIRGAQVSKYYSDFYFVGFRPGEHRCMLYYTFRMSQEMRSKLRERIMNGGKVFAFEKEKTR